MPQHDFGQWVPVSQVCKILSVSRQRVYQLIDAGEINGRRFNNTVLVSLPSVRERRARMARGEKNG